MSENRRLAAAAYKELTVVTDEELEAAIRFYENSPDGQYDKIASLCIRCFRFQRQLDRKYLT